jgi:hypothetical protein
MMDIKLTLMGMEVQIRVIVYLNVKVIPKI